MRSGLYQKGYKALRFVGRQAAFWIFLNVFSGVSLGFLDLAISALLAMTLAILGIAQDSGVKTLLGFTIPQLSAHLLITLLIGVGIARSVFHFIVQQSAHVANEAICARLRLVLFYSVLKKEKTAPSLTEVSHLSNYVFPRASNLVFTVTTALPYFFQAAILFLFLISKSLSNTMLGVGLMVVIGIFLRGLQTKAKQLALHVPDEARKLDGKTIRSIKNWFFLKAIRTMDREHNNIIQQVLSNARLFFRVYFYASFSGAIAPALGIIAIAVLINHQVTTQSMPGIEFLAFIYLYLRFVQNLSQLVGTLGGLAPFVPVFKNATRFFFSFSREEIGEALEPFRGIYSLRTEKLEAPKSVISNGSASARTPPALEFKNVTFTYPNSSKPILKNISFSAAPGSQVAILGPSGSGKSTLLALTLGMVSPTQGEILINGKPAQSFFDDAENRIGYVGPETFLIDGTIRDNLMYGCKQSRSDEEIISAMQFAQLSDWMKATPDFLNYHITENSEGLSTGQRQRLSLARALIERPQLLLLDEVSANLDKETELLVSKTIENLGNQCTVLIVSHRDAVVKHVTNQIQLQA